MTVLGILFFVAFIAFTVYLFVRGARAGQALELRREEQRRRREDDS